MDSHRRGVKCLFGSRFLAGQGFANFVEACSHGRGG